MPNVMILTLIEFETRFPRSCLRRRPLVTIEKLVLKYIHVMKTALFYLSPETPPTTSQQHVKTSSVAYSIYHIYVLRSTFWKKGSNCLWKTTILFNQMVNM